MTEPFRAYEVTVAGAPRERGRAHGEALRPQIRETLESYGEQIAAGMGMPAADFFAHVVRDLGLAGAAQRWTPDLVEEVRGIGEAAGIDFDTIMAWQFVQEMYWYPQEFVAALSPVAGCTALGSAPRGQTTIVAQTSDGAGWGQGRQTVIHLKDSDTGIEAHLLSYPGMIGIYGLNDRGIGVCANSLFWNTSRSTDGLSALFAIRGMLAQPTFADADRFVRAVPHACGVNLMTGGPGHAVSYECSAGAVVPYVPAADSAITYHTNHPLATGDLVPVEEDGWDTNSRVRFAEVQRRMEAAPQPLTWEDAREILSSHDNEAHPICRHYQDNATAMSLFGIILECSTAPVMHVSTGPPCCSEFRHLGFPIQERWD